ncbi:MAG TPA: hypothetical protein VEX38_10880 [Fimbriimonadaceae bacterium]|nr:hypothetical protein [Fimbriimonadaceae bacterium]
MTGRERIVAAARGGVVDRKPTLGISEDSDARVVRTVADAVSGDSALLVDILNPLGRALRQHQDLVRSLVDDPESGHSLLQDLVEETREEISQALAMGADGVFYRLQGADPSACTPMEYGGYFLERDRELLEEVAEARLNVVYIDSSSEPYLDFVSDLPAHVFAWDRGASDLTIRGVRELRAGALACQDPDADIALDLEHQGRLLAAAAEARHV